MAEKDDDENKNLASVSGKFRGIFPRSLRKYREVKATLVLSVPFNVNVPTKSTLSSAAIWF